MVNHIPRKKKIIKKNVKDDGFFPTGCDVIEHEEIDL